MKLRGFMKKSISFYFDIMSPYCYFANIKLPGIAAEYGYEIHYQPIDIPLAKIAAGNYGPSNKDVPSKIKVLISDFERWAKFYNVPFTFPKGFDVKRWNIASLYAIKHGCAEMYIRNAYNKIWAEGVDPCDDIEFRAALSDAGLDADQAMKYAESEKGEADFKKSCVDAHGKGVFGAPIMVVDDQFFWGNDRLDFLEMYLRDK